LKKSTLYENYRKNSLESEKSYILSTFKAIFLNSWKAFITVTNHGA